MDSRRKPLASVDSAWLRMDEPGNLMIVTSVLVLREPVPFACYRDFIASRLDALPRLRERIVKPGMTFGSLAWEPDPRFDLSCHVRVAPLERPDQRSLQNLVGRLMSDPLDPRRPPWQIHFVPQYEDGCAVIGRFHHCIGDGLAMLYVLHMLTDDPPVELTTAPPVPRPGDNHKAFGWLLKRSISSLLSFTRSVEERLADEVKAIIARPASALDAMRDFALGAGTVWKLLFMSSDSRTVFKGPLSDEKRAVWSQPIPIDTLKTIAQATGSTINDIVLAALAGGLRRYLVSHDQRVEGVELRALAPVNLRPIEEASKLGNRFGLLFVPLPLSIVDPLDRLFMVRETTRQIKRSPERLLTFLLLRILGVTPSPLFEMVVNLFARRCTVVVTNVVGPREPLRMTGTTLKQVMFWVPSAGRLAVDVSLFSYTGHLWIGIATDGRLASDPGAILDGVESEIATLVERAGRAR
jgi:diacylglycerol O-acyltransferase